MSSLGNYKYVPASVRKAKAEKNLEKLRKKNPGLQPVTINGRKLAKTWWGIAWNNNLERYADFASRIERGRTYVRNGAVLDLKIEPGQIIGLVQGTRIKPYDVGVVIDPLNPQTIAQIKNACSGNITSLQELVEGKFPASLAEMFTAKGNGLFPTPREIRFNCSCPDWAGMCKHVAALLYGVGARLDEDPTLFFTLRQVNIDDLITLTLIETTVDMLSKSEVKSHRSLEDDDLSALFGIDVAPEGLPLASPEIVTAGASTSNPSTPEQVTKKRGRPRKERVVQESTPVTIVKKRGRPRKASL